MGARTETRLRRLERVSAGRGPDRIVVVERESLEAATAFLQGRPDVDMDRIIFVVTGVSRKGQGPEDWLRAARGVAFFRPGTEKPT